MRINSIRSVIRVRVSDCTLEEAENWARAQKLRIIQTDIYSETSFVIQAETKGFDLLDFQTKHKACLTESCGDIQCSVHNEQGQREVLCGANVYCEHCLRGRHTQCQGLTDFICKQHKDPVSCKCNCFK